MTGRYPSNVGMQNDVIGHSEPFALGMSDKLLPQYLKDAGYATHMVGKWHLGFYQQKRTPYRRGFDSFFGYLGGVIDYYDYTAVSQI